MTLKLRFLGLMFVWLGCGPSTSTIKTSGVLGIDVTATTPSVASGSTILLVATATYSDASKRDVTSLAAWSSGTPSVATAAANGTVTGVAVGTALITASLDGAAGGLTVTVTGASGSTGTSGATGPTSMGTLTALAVTPGSRTVSTQSTLQLTATGTYSDAVTANLTDTVVWSSTAPAIATVNAAGLVTTASAGTVAIIATLASISASITLTVASAGSFDTTFATTGKLTTSTVADVEEAYASVIQSDGKIVVAGSSLSASNYDFAVVRYNTDGTLDASFDSDGKVTTPVGPSGDFGYAAALQADGKIVVVGQTEVGGFYDFGVVRYNTDGSLDTSFDGDGKQTTSFGTGTDAPHSVAIQADGKIVVAGEAFVAGNYNFAIARFNPDGSLDTSFDADGKVTTLVGPNGNFLTSLKIQSDGKIVIGGAAVTGSNSSFALVRYTSVGALDTTFNSTGIVTTKMGTEFDNLNGLAIQSDGKIIAAGDATDGVRVAFVLARYTANGSLDTTFDADGKVRTTAGTGESGSKSVAVQADGKIIAAGYASNGVDNDFAALRYNSDGSLDTAFGTAGLLSIDFSAASDTCRSIALQEDGNILLAGISVVTQARIALARLWR